MREGAQTQTDAAGRSNGHRGEQAFAILRINDRARAAEVIGSLMVTKGESDEAKRARISRKLARESDSRLRVQESDGERERERESMRAWARFHFASFNHTYGRSHIQRRLSTLTSLCSGFA